jgi:hypothetical protein
MTMTVTTTHAPVVLEPEARKVLDDVQAAPIGKLPVEDRWVRAKPTRPGCAAGVAVTAVRYDGITHDFLMLSPLSGTHAARAAVAQAISVLRGVCYGT